jgi:DNA primase
VSAPVTWEEVEAAVGERAPERLTIAADDVPARLEAIGDPLAPALTLAQRLP